MGKTHQILSYIKYILTAKGPDRVHSPFVFNLYYYILKERDNFYPFRKIEQFYTSLTRSKTLIKSSDKGAGTKYHGINRVLGKLVKTSSIPAKWGEILFKLVNNLQPQEILELGTAFGKSSAYLSRAKKRSNVTSIEADPRIHTEASKNLKKLGCKNVTLLNTEIQTYIDGLTDERFDLIFLDADHTFDSTVSYFNQLLPYCKKQSILIFDDIYWSKEMTEAWRTICNHERATVSIDLYRIGIIFLDRDQVKEYFRLRL